MGFLKNIIRRGISDGINKGISKGISDAVGKAVESIVAPKAEAYANKAANQLDEAAKSVDAAASSVNTAAEQAAAAAGGTSNLENAMNRWAQAAGKYAAAMEKAYGETSETMEQALARWNDKLPGFPVWCFGGTELSIDENGREDDGTVYYIVTVKGTNEAALNAYVGVLKAAGFVRKYSGSDETLYRDLGNGEYLLFNQTEALCDDTTVSVGMYRTKNKKDTEPEI